MTLCYLYFIRKERARVSRRGIRAEEEWSARGEDDTAGDRVEVVAGDAPTGAFLTLPQQLFFSAANIFDKQGEIFSLNIVYLPDGTSDWDLETSLN